MIKFFRRIRRKLLDEGSLRKYLVYTLGEILLIVVGILIALQINNGNEKRQLYRLESSYLNLLLSDLKKDSIILQERIKANNRKIGYGRYLDSIRMEMIEIQDPEYFVQALQSTGRNTPKLITTSTYDDLISTGNINSIRDKELRLSIKNYYENIPFFFYDQHYVRSQKLLDIAIEVLPLSNLESTLSRTNDGFKVTKEELQNILAQLKKKESYAFHLKNVIRSYIMLNSSFTKQVQESRMLMEEIKSYLEMD